MISVALPWRVPSEPPVPWARATSQFLTCTAGCASPRSCRTASTTLVRPPRFAGWLLQSPPPSVLKGSLPVARDEVAVGHELAALALGAEAEVLQRDQHGDGEAVVDGRVLDVRGLDAGLGEGRRPRPDGARIREVDAPAHLVLDRLARARAAARAAASRRRATSGLTTTMAPPPSVITQQSRRCSGSEIIGELTTSSTVTTSRSRAWGLCCAWCEAATLIQASCSLVVPYSCMCRIAAMAYWLTDRRARTGTRTARPGCVAP